MKQLYWAICCLRYHPLTSCTRLFIAHQSCIVYCGLRAGLRWGCHHFSGQIVDRRLMDGADEYLQLMDLASVIMDQICHAHSWSPHPAYIGLEESTHSPTCLWYIARDYTSRQFLHNNDSLSLITKAHSSKAAYACACSAPILYL